MAVEMKIVCAGEMLVDIIACPVNVVSFLNNTCQVEDIRITSGGDANNNAVNFAKLGHEVTYLGRVGCDGMGDYVTTLARQAGINMDHAARSDTSSQTKSLILIDRHGNRTFLQYPGTSAEFCFEDCDLAALEGADLLQISGTFHLPRFDGEGAARLLRGAKERGLITSMDITTDRTGRWQGILDTCYPFLDYFLPSVEQASQVAGTEEPGEIAAFFLDRGVKNVLVKLGGRGSYFKNSETAFYAGTYRGLRVVETTGAGDAFCAGFLTGVGKGLPPEGCVTLGTACSAFVIQAVGATAGMRSLAEIEAFIRAEPPLDFWADTRS